MVLFVPQPTTGQEFGVFSHLLWALLRTSGRCIKGLCCLFCSLVEEAEVGGELPTTILNYSLGSSDNVLLNSPSLGPDKGLFPKGARSRQHEN